MSTGKQVESGANAPSYNAEQQKSDGWSLTKKKVLFAYAIGVTVALILVIIISSVIHSRIIYVHPASVKKYSVMDMSGTTPMREDIEIDMSNNFAVFYLSGDSMMTGTFTVIDYTKSMTGLYEPNSRRCYLGGGIDLEIYDLETLDNMLEKNTTQQETKKNFYYKLGNNFPVSDKSILPAPMKSVCMSLPVYWLEPALSASHSIQKRGSLNINFPIGPFRISFSINW